MAEGVEFVQVGHHASRTASSLDFLQITSPEVAIYMAKEGNSYGHPHEETITNLTDIGAEIYGTDVHGTTVVTTLCRRIPGITVILPRARKKEELHLVVDATGLKVYGEGEWKVRKHGKSKRRTWRKVHLGFDEGTGEVMACVLTRKEGHEKNILPTLLNEVSEPIDHVSGDGGYDFKTCYDAIAERKAKAVIPPRKRAIFHNNGFMDARDDNLRRIKEIGREAWKRESDYHRRSLSETGIYRLKRIFGGALSSKKLDSQNIEVRLRCKAMNLMTGLGMPKTYPVT